MSWKKWMLDTKLQLWKRGLDKNKEKYKERVREVYMLHS